MTQFDFPNEKTPLFRFDLQTELPSIIKVIGVGGGGSNAVNHMYQAGIKGVDFLVCNTDHQALEISPVPHKIQLGPGLTEGRGAGALPEVGRQSALENIDDIRRVLSDNTKMVFITAGMGGGTGTGAAPVIAQIAKEMGVLTVGIVTVPFAFEGRKRKQQAEAGLEEMKKHVDALLIICNDKLREIYGNLNLSRAFGHADDVLTVAAKSIAEIITNTMHMNVDFADIQTVMKDSGVAIMGSASVEGDNRAVRAAEAALDSPLLNDNVIEGARYILLNITSADGESEVSMDEVGEINDYIQAQAGQTADIIMGIGVDNSLGNKVAVTVIATGFKTNVQKATEQQKPEKVVFKLEDDRPVVAPAPVNEVKPQPVVSFTEEVVVNENPLEPVLIVRDEIEMNTEVTGEMDFSQEDTFVVHQLEAETIVSEFELPAEMDDFIPATVYMESSVSDEVPAVEPIVHRMEEQPSFQTDLTPEEEMYRRSRERIMRLKELSYKMSSPNGLADLEREPAYKRRNVKLDHVPSSQDSSVSRFTLSMDGEDRKPEIRQNNTFLHDRVD